MRFAPFEADEIVTRGALDIRREDEVEDHGGSGIHAVDAGTAARPGVPMEAEADREASPEPERQATGDQHLIRAALDEPTPVVGTAQPPHGLSGAIRRLAYSIPETRARHWMLLMVGDRVDVLEHRIGDAVAEPLERLGLDDAAAWTRSNPAGAAVTAAAGVAAATLALRAARRRL